MEKFVTKTYTISMKKIVPDEIEEWEQYLVYSDEFKWQNGWCIYIDGSGLYLEVEGQFLYADELDIYEVDSKVTSREDYNGLLVRSRLKYS